MPFPRPLFASFASLLALAILAPTAWSQEMQLPIRVKVTKRPDGTTVNTTVDPNTHTCVEETRSSGDKLIQKASYQLDMQGRPLGGVVENGRGEFLYNVAFKNDPVTGLVLEENDTDKAGRPVRRLVFRYNAAGQLTSSEAFDGNGNAIQSGPAIKDRDKKKPAAR